MHAARTFHLRMPTMRILSLLLLSTLLCDSALAQKPAKESGKKDAAKATKEAKQDAKNTKDAKKPAQEAKKPAQKTPEQLAFEAEMQQKGFKAGRKRTQTLGNYQEIRIRRLHKTLDSYLNA